MRDRLPEQEANIALLIDADNASPEHLDEVLLVLGELGTINIRRAYGNWAKASLKGWGNLTGAHSIVPMQQFDVVKGKSATDMRMTIDAMDLLYRGNVDGFGIMSSRQRFSPPRPAHPRGRAAGLRLRDGEDARLVSSRPARASSTSARWLWMMRKTLEQPTPQPGQRPVDPELLQVLGAPTRRQSATRKATRPCRSSASAPRRCRASLPAISASPGCPT